MSEQRLALAQPSGNRHRSLWRLREVSSNAVGERSTVVGVGVLGNSMVRSSGLCNCVGVSRNYFGEDVAARYDLDPTMFRADVLGPTVDLLAELAGDGPALEFAVGT